MTITELHKALEEYLAIRRTLGFKLSDEGKELPKFLQFLEQQGVSFITTELALRWATLPIKAQPAHWAARLRMVRLFAEYCHATEPRTEIPPHSLLPYRAQRAHPYIYSDDEILRLIEATKQLRSPTGFRAATYSTLFALLAATGMRVSEPIHLDCEDVDLTRGLLTVQQTKFGKSRLIPLHSSTQSALQQYVAKRDQLHPDPTSPSFFVSEWGQRLTVWSVRWTFVKVSHQIGLRKPDDTHGPRLHDLRHRFAVKTLLGWYQANVDVEQALPKLSAYLGHTHVNDTYWYISGVPELLELATLRLDKTGGGAWS